MSRTSLTEGDSLFPCLHKQTKANSLDSVRSLIKEGNCDLRAKNRTGSTVLHIAAYYGRLDLVKELLGSGHLDIQDKNDYKWTSLHYLHRFHQPLNMKLNIALQVEKPKNNSRKFQFRYFKRQPNVKN